MSNTAKGWWLFGSIAVVGLMIVACIAGNTNASPRDYIDDKYSCSPDPEKYNHAICRSSSSVQTVRSQISRAVKPIDTHTDYSSGKVFLQYGKDIIALTKVGSGTQIEVDDYRSGYNRHSTYIGHIWTSSRPSGSSGGYSGFSGGK